MVERRLFVCLLVLGFVIRLVLFVAVQDVGIHTDDERDYVTLAGSLLDGNGFAFGSHTTSIRPPLYPGLIAAVWQLTPDRSLQAVRGAQIGLSLVSVWLLWWIACQCFGWRVGLGAACIWCLYPSFLYAGVLLLTEVLFTTLLLAALASAVAVVQGRRPLLVWALAAGLFVGLGALTRSVLWPLPVVVAPALGALTRGGWRARVGVTLAVFAAYAAVVTPWAVRNTRLQHTLVIVDTMGGMNLRMGNFEFTIEDRMWDGVSLSGDKAWSHQMVVEHPEASTWTEGQREKWARKRAAEYMLAHPWTTLRRSVLKFADFWGLEREYIAALQKGEYLVPTWFKAISSVAVVTAYVAVALLCCVGLLGVPWLDWRVHMPGLILILWICGIHSIVFGHSRYHLPLIPIVAMYAAAAVVHRPWHQWRGRSAAALGAAIGVAVLLAIWTHEVLVRDASRLRQFLG